MTLNDLKNRVVQAIDQNRSRIIGLGDAILSCPELGYREEKTSRIVKETFRELGIPYEDDLALTGVKGKLAGCEEGLNICLMGEMDALPCGGDLRPNANGISHACGHNAQMAALLGAAIGLSESGVMSGLPGKVSLLAAPAEEFIDLDFRKKLIREGRIKYAGGKQELIYEGAFDDVDMAMMIHAAPDEPGRKLYIKGYNLGFITKTITFRGKAAHGSKPFDGVNALNAAALSIIGMHTNREIFREEERIRIHPIITKGGDVVNTVPDEVCIDTYVRGATLEAIKKGNDCVERSCRGAVQMIGAEVSFENTSGYLPLREDALLSDLMAENAEALMGAESIVSGREITGSTDAGDLSCLIPVIQPSIGGFEGGLHSEQFHITNRETAYLDAAKLLALTAVDLLYNDCEKGKAVRESFTPLLTKEQYLSYLEEGIS